MSHTHAETPSYSIIIPVYNRPKEMKEMLTSLEQQTFRAFELIVVEDGSWDTCEDLVYAAQLEVAYYFKPNTGPGDSRNFGMQRARGKYLLFFDSDCILPLDYFEKLHERIRQSQPDAFGGSDRAHESFSPLQQAISYAMTSFFTTGGIRGGKKSLDQFQPRSFNMGIKKEVYEAIGGFCNLHPGEDPDLSFRIRAAGYTIVRMSDVAVFHKRRIDLSQFLRQVYKFGVARVILNRWHPGTAQWVYYLPSVFLLGTAMLLASAVVWSYTLLPLLSYSVFIFLDAKRKNTWKVALLAVPAAFCQLIGYGYGFLKAKVKLQLFKQSERTAFPSFFFSKKAEG